MAFFERISEGLSRSREKFKESMNVLLDRGPNLDEEFWDTLEETLILSDVGGTAANAIVENLRDRATRLALPDAYAVLDLLNDQIAATFAEDNLDLFNGEPALILFVGINGTGKTTTVGKIAKEAADAGRNVILGSADTFRAAAIEQLEVWARRADVEMVTRERGSDPASVCYLTIERAEATDADLVLIDTAGRLHTSADLMRELEKVVSVVRKRSKLPVYTILVIDATTGQNGLQQAREFHRALQLDGLVVTKLDGTAKGGIALAVSHELDLPIVKIAVGEGIDDLRDFDAHEFSSALIGDFDERYDEAEDGLRGENAKEAAVSAGERRRDVLEGAAKRPAITCSGEEGQPGEASVEAEELEQIVDTSAEAQELEAASFGQSLAAASDEADAEPVTGDPEESREVRFEEVLGEPVEESAVELAEEPAEQESALEEDSEAAAEEAVEIADQEAYDDEESFSDEELAELALAAGSEEDDDETDNIEEEEPRKKHFWERWF